VETLKVATLKALSVAVPSEVVPSLNVTVPVGVPEAPGVTVAVKVAALPAKMGFAPETRTVEVFSSTVSVNTPEVPDRFNASPP
jgi:hypothetical protein